MPRNLTLLVHEAAKDGRSRWRQCFVSVFFVATLGVPADAEPITFNDPTATGRDWFGYSASLDGNNVLIGAEHDDTNGTNVGQAHLFDLSGNLLHPLCQHS